MNRLQLADWSIFEEVISNRNSRFFSNFWKEVFSRLKTKLLINIAWHSQINEEFERINQTVKIALRYLIIIYSDIDWVLFLSTLQAQFNNSINVVIDLSFNEVVYEFKIRKFISVFVSFSISFAERDEFEFIVNRRMKYKQKTVVVIVFVNAKIKVYYDARHQSFMFNFENRVYLRLHHEYILFDHFNRKMFNQRCDSFFVKRRVDRLAYEFELLFIWRIYSVIFIAQLKLYVGENFYRRSCSDYSSVVKVEENIENWKFYEMKRIEVKRFRKFDRTIVIQYFVKWLKYKSEFNEWKSLLYFDDCLKLVKKFEQRKLTRKDKKKLVNKSVVGRRNRKPLAATIFRSVDVFIIAPPSAKEQIVDIDINSQTVVVDVEKQMTSAIINIISSTITTVTIVDESVKRERERLKKITN